MKKWFLAIPFATIGVLIGSLYLYGSVQNCNKTDFWCYESGPSQALIMQGRMDASGNIATNGNTITIGGPVNPSTAAVIVTTNATSANTPVGNDQAIKIPATLLCSSTTVEGTVLIATIPVSGNALSVCVSTSANRTDAIGVADSAQSTGNVVNVLVAGFALAQATGAISAGDLLTTTTTVSGYGYLVSSNTAVNIGNFFAVALSSNSSGTSGLLKVKIIH